MADRELFCKLQYIHKWTDGKSTWWTVRASVPDPAGGRRIDFRRDRRMTEGEAREELEKFLAKVAAGVPVGKAARRTVNQAIDEWIDGLNASQNTKDGYLYKLLPLRGEYGPSPIAELDAAKLVALRTLIRTSGYMRADGRQGNPVSEYTGANMVKHACMMIEVEKNKGHYLGRNPRDIIVPEGANRQVNQWDDLDDYNDLDDVDDDADEDGRTERPTLTAAQVTLVHEDSIHDPWRVAWRLALNGLRRSEISGLRWKDIDFDRKVLYIRRGRVTQKGNANSIHKTKTKKSKRPLPLFPKLEADLIATRDLQEMNKAMLGDAYVDTGFVIVWPDGRIPTPRTLLTHWKKMMKRLDLPPLVLQDSRHTFNTLAHQEEYKLPRAEIMAWLGHTTLKMSDHYNHSQWDHLVESFSNSRVANL